MLLFSLILTDEFITQIQFYGDTSVEMYNIICPIICQFKWKDVSPEFFYGVSY